jgi:hypothetical protein
MEKENTKIADEKFPTPSLQWNDIIKVLGSIAGFIGLGGALLWLFGRSFYVGLLSSFGASSLTVSIAPEDFLEKGTASLVYFILDILFTLFLYYLAYLFKIFFYEKILRRTKSYILRIVSILLVFTIGVISGILLTNTSNLGISASYFYEDTVNLVSIFMIFTGLETSLLFASPLGIKNQNELAENQSIISSQTPIALARILILIAMLGNFLVIQSSSSYVGGYFSGCMITLRKSTPVVMFSNTPVFTEGQTRTQELYVYNDYFLLFTDRDYYYLYREIDPSNNKPKNLFVVSKDIAKTMQMATIPVPKDEINKYSQICTSKIRNR